MKRAALALIAAAFSLGACATKAPEATGPASYYSCADGTRLAVRLAGASASVAVNGAAAISLRGSGGAGATTYTNGTQTLATTPGQVGWTNGAAPQTMCSPSGS